MLHNVVESDRPVPQALRNVLEYTNDPFVYDAAHELQMSEFAVLELFFELKLYFYLCYYYAERLPAPVHIDRLWHIFLAREDEYAAFCLGCFVGTIEHIPHDKPDEASVSRTVDRAHEKFGPRLAANWQRNTRCDGIFKAAA